MTETQLRNKVVSIMKGWIGCKESDGSHMKILDVYNSHSPLPRGVKMLSTYAWCAATVSAAFIQAKLTDIGFVECSCGKMIELYKKKRRWMETDSYVPSPGDLVMYDWDDKGTGDNAGAPEHVGMVVSVSDGSMRVIEGNKSDAVGYRTLKINGKYIRGFCLPDYASKATKKDTATTVKPDAKPVKIDPAMAGPSATYAKTWTVKAGLGLHLRTGANKKKTSLGIMPNGTKLRCYGYYTKQSDGTIWLLVIVQNGKLKGKTGFCSKEYLK